MELNQDDIIEPDQTESLEEKVKYDLARSKIL